MDKAKIQTLKGFRDFLPKEAKKRQYVIDVLKNVFGSYGFEPLETPALEYEEVLLGKYGEEGDKLMYRFEDLGGRKIAMRYDQTVPLARVVAQYGSAIPMPFKRYQMQSVWRAENPQKGRFREFLQCDADIVGTSSSLADAEVIVLAVKSLQKLGFKKFKVLINDRAIFRSWQLKLELPDEKATLLVRTIDKIKKIGKTQVKELSIKEGFTPEQIEKVFEEMDKSEPTEKIQEISFALKKYGISEQFFEYSPYLARGLDYYTSTIFEIEIEEYTAGSVCGGGRYDNLIGMFLQQTSLPAVGFAFGFDRLIEAMEDLNLFPDNLITTKVLVTIFSSELQAKSIEIASKLRSNGITTELYSDEEAKLDKQIKYADQKGIPYILVIGPNEASKNRVTIRNMQTGEQKTVNQKETLEELKRN